MALYFLTIWHYILSAELTKTHTDDYVHWYSLIEQQFIDLFIGASSNDIYSDNKKIYIK